MIALEDPGDIFWRCVKKKVQAKKNLSSYQFPGDPRFKIPV